MKARQALAIRLFYLGDVLHKGERLRSERRNMERMEAVGLEICSIFIFRFGDFVPGTSVLLLPSGIGGDACAERSFLLLFFGHEVGVAQTFLDAGISFNRVFDKENLAGGLALLFGAERGIVFK